MDVVDLREFYNSSWGRIVRRLLRGRVLKLWPDLRGQVLAALGYATPLLRPWLGQAQAILALMPDTQGVAYWPREGENVSVLTALEQLPLGDETVDRVLVMHALEMAPDPAAVLQEVWRVLRAGGQAIFIVPSRRGLWARSDHTPFGHGRPFSTAQMRALLREEGFCVEKTSHALLMPPLDYAVCQLAAPFLERLGALCRAPWGGVLVIQAGKQVFTPALVPSAKRARRRLVLPLPFPSAPVGAGRVGQNRFGFPQRNGIE